MGGIGIGIGGIRLSLLVGEKGLAPVTGDLGLKVLLSFCSLC